MNERRKLVAAFERREVSVTRACELLGVSRRRLRYVPKKDDSALLERFNGTLRDECLNTETFHGRDHARAAIKLFARFYNTDRPHSALGEAVTPQEFFEAWKQKDDFGGADLGRCPRPRDLPLCAPNDASNDEAHDEAAMPGAQERGLAGRAPNQPDRPAVHVGAPVASQQSRTLRVDGTSVVTTSSAGKFPAGDSTS